MLNYSSFARIAGVRGESIALQLAQCIATNGNIAINNNDLEIGVVAVDHPLMKREQIAQNKYESLACEWTKSAAVIEKSHNKMNARSLVLNHFAPAAIKK